MIVLKDANLEEACKAAAFGAMQHQGQICMLGCRTGLEFSANLPLQVNRTDHCPRICVQKIF
jgi:hypothetical protein